MFAKTKNVFFFVFLTITFTIGVSTAHPLTDKKKRNFNGVDFLNLNHLAVKKVNLFGDTTKRKSLYFGDRYGSKYSGFFTPFRQRKSPFMLGLPSNYNTNIQLDSSGRFYTIYENIGNNSLRAPSTIPFDKYLQIRAEELNKQYWKSISKTQDDGSPVNSGRIIPPISLGSFADRLFGGSNLDLQPNGSVMLDFGGRWQRIDNPQIPIRQQRNGGLFFDQQIQMNLVGKIGDKLNMNINWDTKSTFQYENNFKIGYSSMEEDIVQEVQLGNVSMPTSNSLITGGRNLLGVKTRLRFGKLWINTIVSNQRGTSETFRVRGGAQARQFEIRADQYEDNRHFFLGHFFRGNYEPSLRTIPVVTSGVVVTRLEVYVTNRNNNTQTLRNVVAFMDLGEGNPFLKNNPAVGTFQPNTPSSNAANQLYQNVIQNTAARDVDQVSGIMEDQFRLTKGSDYELLRGARKLEEREYVFHPNLGYISLLTPLRNDEILAVSYEYTYNGTRYRVGELTENYQNQPANSTIVMKMLRPSTIRTDLPMWDLMMKNIYGLQTNQLERNNFQLRVVYRDDNTGIDNPNLQEGINLKDIPLVQVFGMDKLNQNNDPQADGNFDYIDGLTIDGRLGRIIFPVLEPFGSLLQSKFLPEVEQQLINKYVFNELYSGTKADAMLLTSKSKFFLKGSFQSATGTEIQLPGLNISPNSVSVRAGGTVLQEGKDFSVDYQFGRVRITNEGVMRSGKEIIIQYERADLFNFQTRNLFGTDIEYRLSKDVRFTGTLMHLNERPNITRVSIGTEPTRNTMFGFGVNIRKDAPILTKLIDKLPFISTKEPSNFTFAGEFAAIIPGANQLIGRDGGTSYIDDFEASEIPYDLTRQPLTWALGTTPQQFLPNSRADTLAYAYKRAKLAWYSIDNTAFFNVGSGQRPPANVGVGASTNHYTRPIPFNEISKNRDAQIINQPEFTFDMAFYPDERGMYNYTTDLNPNGSLRNPRNNFGAVTKAVTYDIDFDNINVQYIEFFLLDPFIQGADGQISRNVNGQQVLTNNTTGGQLIFNIGSISEDYIPDSRHGFENGLPANEQQKDVSSTSWGKVTRAPYLTNAFSAEGGARERQDVGMDGLSDAEERTHFGRYLNNLRGVLSPNAYQQVEADPSNDNFLYYLNSEFTDNNLSIFDRYRFFNGQEGNSPANAGTAASSTFPDNEDLNRDNTLNDLETYYEYKVDLRPGALDRNPYVISKIITTPSQGIASATWYQFRIPIRQPSGKVGNISNFKSIRFIRTYLTDWQQPVILRMAQFQFVGTQWRPFLEDLRQPGFQLPKEPYNAQFNVSSINIEENGASDGINTPYVLPPGFIRDLDFASNTQARRNEQSLRLCVDNLGDGDARGVYKNIVLDMVNYQRVKMFIHAQSATAKDGEVNAFLRLGTDFKENYYEIEVPLKLTPNGTLDPELIWAEENRLDIAIQDLINLKANRNRQNLAIRVPYSEMADRFKITVVGNPDLSSVQTLMVGIRNPADADEQPKNVCIWVNELRVAGFNNRAGWAATARLNTQLADLALVNASVRYSTPFFGGIQDKIAARTRDHNLEYDFSANIKLDKFLLGKLGISAPMYVSYERRLSTPYFNPLDPDMPLELALETRQNINKNDFLALVRDESVRRSINFTNVKKNKLKQGAKSNLWDIENLVFNYSYNDFSRRDIRIAEFNEKFTRAGVGYTYSSASPPIEPFKKISDLDSKYLKFIKDFNLNLMPNNINIRADVDRRFIKTQLRNADLGILGILPQYEKAFTFNRLYNVRWGLTRNLNLDYQSQVYAIVDEPLGDINNDLVSRNSDVTKRDSVIRNILRLGRMKNFQQNIGLTYKLPLDKFPVTDWIDADTRYQAGYTWTAGAVGISDSLGNNMQNNNNLTLTGQLNLRKLYDKSRFLQQVNNPNKTVQLLLRGEEKKRRLQARIKRYEKRKAIIVSKLTGIPIPKEIPEVGVAQADTTKGKVRRKLRKIDKYELKIQDLQYDTLKFAKKIAKYKNKVIGLKESIELPTPVVAVKIDTTKKKLSASDTAKYNKKVRKIEKRLKKFTDKIQEIEERQKRDKEPRKPPAKPIQVLTRLLMSVQKVNFSYTTTNSTLFPGVLSVPSFFGIDQNNGAPGLGFILGSQNPDLKNQASRNGWLSRSPLQNNSYGQANTTNLNLRLTVEPFKDFDIQLEAKKVRSANYSEVFRFVTDINGHRSETTTRSGMYSISFFSLRTAFAGDDGAFNSPLFTNFITNRNAIKSRLDGLTDTGKRYQINSQDVLIPAFLAAYSGGDVVGQSLSPFPALPIPNWKITYSGLSNLEIFKKAFRSVQITHSYSSDYNVGGYTSSLLYGPDYVGLNIREQDIPLATFDPLTGDLVPVLVMNQINITENFNPLLGINLRTVKNLTLSVRYARQRSIALNLTNVQVTELKNSDITVEGSYTKAGFKIPFKIRGGYKVLKNDLTFRLSLTARDTRTLQRRIDDTDNQVTTVTAGNLNVQIRPTIAYMVNQRVNLQFYFDRSINQPYISNSFKRTNTNFGIQVRFNLAQ
jgi:cell surface protein SprA